MQCERCGGDARLSTCSIFNAEQICLECKDREENHPDYEKAQKAEDEALRRGEFNFPGIGLLANLHHS
jgi:hypothetical protein